MKKFLDATPQISNHSLRLTFFLFVMMCIGCSSKEEVIVYTALDREYSEPLFREFTEKTGISVRAKYDSEAYKSVGLANLIIAESKRPRCDLFWNNEILNTLRLDSRQLLTPFASQEATNFPAQFYDPEHHWHGFAARARVFLVNRDLVAIDDFPDSIQDLAATRWQGKVGLAKPLFGTTATHAACLFEFWGAAAAEEYFQKVLENAIVFPGNKQVAQAVSTGKIHFGITDTDDAIVELEAGHPVEIVYPDQADHQCGALVIPNTLGLVAGGRHPSEAEKLVEFLLSSEVENRLAEGRSAQIPLRSDSTFTSKRIKQLADIKRLNVDFTAAAGRWDEVSKILKEMLSN